MKSAPVDTSNWRSIPGRQKPAGCSKTIGKMTWSLAWSIIGFGRSISWEFCQLLTLPCSSCLLTRESRTCSLANQASTVLWEFESHCWRQCSNNQWRTTRRTSWWRTVAFRFTSKIRRNLQRKVIRRSRSRWTSSSSLRQSWAWWKAEWNTKWRRERGEMSPARLVLSSDQQLSGCMYW